MPASRVLARHLRFVLFRVIPLFSTALHGDEEAALAGFYAATHGDSWVYSYPMNWCAFLPPLRFLSICGSQLRRPGWLHLGELWLHRVAQLQCGRPRPPSVLCLVRGFLLVTRLSPGHVSAEARPVSSLDLT